MDAASGSAVTVRSRIDHVRPLVPLLVLAVLTVASGLPLVLRCVVDGQIDYNEGWNASRQQAASLWQPLYGSPPVTSVTNYPPLSFHLIGLLGRLCGDVVLTGRVGSMLAVAVIGWVAVRIGFCLSRSYAVAACCGLFWFAGIELWTPERIGTNDPQLLAMALQAVGLLVFMNRPVRSGALVVSALLVSLSLFAKHNLLALPIGMTLSLVFLGDRRALSIWILAGLAGCIVLYAATIGIDGRFFLTHLLAPRAFLPRQAFKMLAFYTVVTAPVLVMVGYWCWQRRASTAERPLVLAWVASLLEILAFSGGDGVAHNIFQDAILMNALLQPLALQRIVARLDRRFLGNVLVGASLLPLLILTVGVPSYWLNWKAMVQQQATFRQAVSLVHDRPGAAACESLLLCFRAGKASAFDAYYVQDQIKLGRLSPQSIDALVERHALATIEIGSPDDPEPADPANVPKRFSRSFMTALWTYYRPVLTTPEFTIFVPADVPAGGPHPASAVRNAS